MRDEDLLRRQEIDKANSNRLIPYFDIVFKLRQDDINLRAEWGGGTSFMHKTILDNLYRDLEAFREVLRNEEETILTIASEYRFSRAKLIEQIAATKEASTRILRHLGLMNLGNLNNSHVHSDEETPATMAEIIECLTIVDEMTTRYIEIFDRTQESWSPAP